MIPLVLSFLLQTAIPGNVVANPYASKVVNVSWSYSNSPGYTFSIFRASGQCSGTGTFSQIATKWQFKNFTDATLSPSSTYCYYITATTNSVNSSPSAKAQAITPSTDTRTKSIRLNWNHTDTTGTVKFRMMRGDGFCSADTTLYTIASGISGRTWTDTDVVVNATYCYHVISYTDAGGLSNPSNKTHVSLSTTVTVSPVMDLTVTLK